MILDSYEYVFGRMNELTDFSALLATKNENKEPIELKLMVCKYRIASI